MTAPIATGILFFAALIGLVVVGKLGKRPYYQPIAAGDDPLDEGQKGWAGLARVIRAKRLIKMLYVLGVLAVILYGSVIFREPVQALYDHYNPPPTATPTLTPTMTPTLPPTPSETPIL